jgi:SH3-domain binding protein 5
MFMVILYDKF